MIAEHPHPCQFQVLSLSQHRHQLVRPQSPESEGLEKEVECEFASEFKTRGNQRQAADIAVDSEGNAYVTGTRTST